MSVLVAAAGGFIGRHLAAALPADRVRTAAHADAAAALPGAAAAVWCGRNPRLGKPGWQVDDDPEVAFGRACAGAGVHLLSLGTRKVYAPSPRPLAEDDPTGTADAYGRDRLAVEQALVAIPGLRLTRLRLANVFGFEPGRPTFLGAMLDGLARDGTVRFAMSPFTPRDFLPVEDAAAMLAALALDPPGGVVNLGSGIALPTGRLAMALLEGFGGGRLLVEDAAERDGFVLDVRRLFWRTGLAVTEAAILEAARAAGRRLRR
ncbi:MAG: NAD-dependent epimerase/dehydratase family protein [Geminicoccaceae bacterium]